MLQSESIAPTALTYSDDFFDCTLDDGCGCTTFKKCCKKYKKKGKYCKNCPNKL